MNDSTSWRLLAIEGFSSSLELELRVDTRAPAVIVAIEEAAERQGIALERVVDEDDQAEAEEPTSPPPIAPGSVSNLVITGQSDTRHR